MQTCGVSKVDSPHLTETLHFELQQYSLKGAQEKAGYAGNRLPISGARGFDQKLWATTERPKLRSGSRGRACATSTASARTRQSGACSPRSSIPIQQEACTIEPTRLVGLPGALLSANVAQVGGSLRDPRIR
jgi:hypothetical protein